MFIGSKIICVFLYFIIPCFIFSQTNTPDSLIKLDLLKNDLKFLWENLNAIHPNSSQFQKLLEPKYFTILDKITSPMSVNDFYLTVAPIVSDIKDGHTSLSMVLSNQNSYFIPLDILFVEEKVFIKKDYTSQFDDSKLFELIEINKTPIKVIQEKMFSIMTGETEMFKKRSLETDVFKILMAILFQRENSFEVVAQNSKGEKFTKVIKALTRPEIKSKRTKNIDKKNSFLISTDDSIAVLTLVSFEEDDIEDLFEDAFESIKEQGIKNIIIDVRNNLGGDSGNVEKLLSYFVLKTYRPFTGVNIKVSDQFKSIAKTRIPKLLRWLPLEQLDERGRKIWNAEIGSLVFIAEEDSVIPCSPDIHFTGKVIVLMNGHTFSAASLFAHFVKQYKIGVVAGLESGGLIGTCYGDRVNVTLPNTGIVLTVATTEILYDCVEKKSHGVLPDVQIWLDVEKEKNGIDTQLERTKMLFNH